jgi:hypothetical protein
MAAHTYKIVVFAGDYCGPEVSFEGTEYDMVYLKYARKLLILYGLQLGYCGGDQSELATWVPECEGYPPCVLVRELRPDFVLNRFCGR